VRKIVFTVVFFFYLLPSLCSHNVRAHTNLEDVRVIESETDREREKENDDYYFQSMIKKIFDIYNCKEQVKKN